MRTKIGKRIVSIGRTTTRQPLTLYRQPIGRQPATSHRIVLIKNGVFVRGRPKR